LYLDHSPASDTIVKNDIQVSDRAKS
jgi:hypothetical protein